MVSLLQAKGQYEQAKTLIERAIAFCEKLHGENSITRFYRKQLESLEERVERRNSISTKKSP